MGLSDVDRAHALINELFGPPDAAGDAAVAVLHAHGEALTWVHEVTGRYPAPAMVAARLAAVAGRLRDGTETGDPVAVLHRTAADALAEYRRGAAA